VRGIFPPTPIPSKPNPESGNHVAYTGPPSFHKLAGVVTRAVVLITSGRETADPLFRLEIDAPLGNVQVAPVGSFELQEREIVLGIGPVGLTVTV
jgi:hypothetical protein